MRVVVVIGNPNPGGRTTAVAREVGERVDDWWTLAEMPLRALLGPRPVPSSE